MTGQGSAAKVGDLENLEPGWGGSRTERLEREASGRGHRCWGPLRGMRMG